jgi:hypothetical protein
LQEVLCGAEQFDRGAVTGRQNCPAVYLGVGRQQTQQRRSEH